jgi:hypothetical protein
MPDALNQLQIPNSLDTALEQVIRGLDDLFPLDAFETGQVPPLVVANRIAEAIVDGIAKRHYLDEHLVALVLSENMEEEERQVVSARFGKRMRARRKFLWDFNKRLRGELRWRLRRVRANAAYDRHYGVRARTRRVIWWCVDYAACFAGWVLVAILALLAFGLPHCSGTRIDRSVLALKESVEVPGPVREVPGPVREVPGPPVPVLEPDPEPAKVKPGPDKVDPTRKESERDPEKIKPTRKEGEKDLVKVEPQRKQSEPEQKQGEPERKPDGPERKRGGPGQKPPPDMGPPAPPATRSEIPVPKPGPIGPTHSEVIASKPEATLGMSSLIPRPRANRYNYEECLERCVQTCETSKPDRGQRAP